MVKVNLSGNNGAICNPNTPEAKTKGLRCLSKPGLYSDLGYIIKACWEHLQ